MTTYFTAGTHFGHKSILSMCKRPFSDIDEHDRALIDAWNAVVGPDDVVYHLGDFAYRASPQQTRRIFDQLNGTKYLVVGNHDFKNETQRLGWASIAELRSRHGASADNGLAKRLVGIPHDAVVANELPSDAAKLDLVLGKLGGS